MHTNLFRKISLTVFNSNLSFHVGGMWSDGGLTVQLLPVGLLWFCAHNQMHAWWSIQPHICFNLLQHETTSAADAELHALGHWRPPRPLQCCCYSPCETHWRLMNALCLSQAVWLCIWTSLVQVSERVIGCFTALQQQRSLAPTLVTWVRSAVLSYRDRVTNSAASSPNKWAGGSEWLHFHSPSQSKFSCLRFRSAKFVKCLSVGKNLSGISASYVPPFLDCD